MAVDLYKPRFMLQMMEQMPPLRTLLLDTFFKQKKTFPTEQVDFDVKKGGMAMAPFVSPRIGSSVLDRQGYKTFSYKPPLVAPKRVMTTDDLDTRLPGEALYSGYNPDQRKAALLQDDLKELDDAITRREEWMAAMALFNGEIPVVGEGVDDVISFEFDNQIVVDAGKVWSDYVNSRPLDDLNGAADRVARSGYSANIAIGDSASIRALVRNQEVQKLLDIKNYQMGLIEPKVLANGATYFGFLPECNLHIYAYSAFYADNDNENPDFPGVKPGDKGFVPKVYPLIPNGKVFVGPTQLPAKMLYGVIKDIQIGSHMRARVPKQWDQQEPSERYLKISSRPLPCPMDLDAWATLDVL
ncbi:MAG: major capsid protein [Clostridiales bacterium]|jgi:hypothetical protein|nr:major capsid protein [Clostridiales bacterium]